LKIRVSFIEKLENVKYLIIESNFKIFAYTENNFEKSILEFLCDIEYFFPSFIVGNITRNSIRRALKKGATAQSILRFLSLHSNELMDYKSTYKGVDFNIPDNIVQQIVIWEEEKNAIISQKGNNDIILSKTS
jgi:transcription initiation factor TFIIH subunit 4